jgi:hypothetical protein
VTAPLSSPTGVGAVAEGAGRLLSACAALGVSG